jgi:hypothetical protein
VTENLKNFAKYLELNRAQLNEALNAMHRAAMAELQCQIASYRVFSSFADHLAIFFWTEEEVGVVHWISRCCVLLLAFPPGL